MSRLQIRFSEALIFTLILGWLTQAGGMGVRPQPGKSGLYAYAIRYGMKELAGISYQVAYLDQIDIRTDEVVKSTPIDPGYNSITILDNHHVILCNTGGELTYGGADIFNVKQNKKMYTFKLEGHDPRIAIPAQDKLFIVTMKTEQTAARIKNWTSFEIFDRKTLKKIKDLNLRDGENVDERISLTPDGSRIYFISWNPVGYPEVATGLIGIVDVNSGEFIKQTDYADYFGGGRWIANCNNKLYVTAVDATSKEDLKPEEERKLNNRLFVFNAEDLSLIKTIPIGVLAEQLTYVPALNKLYIAHSSMDERTPQYIEVLDCKKDVVIDKIPVKGFRRMSYVGNYKLYVSHSGGPLFLGAGGQAGILVIDVRTNKVLKKIPGEYAPISYNFEPVDEIK